MDEFIQMVMMCPVFMFLWPSPMCRFQKTAVYSCFPHSVDMLRKRGLFASLPFSAFVKVEQCMRCFDRCCWLPSPLPHVWSAALLRFNDHMLRKRGLPALLCFFCPCHFRVMHDAFCPLLSVTFFLPTFSHQRLLRSFPSSTVSMSSMLIL